MIRKLAFSIVFFALLSPLHGVSASEKIIYEKNSLYQYIVVSDDRETGIRYLHNNEITLRQGGMDMRNPDKLVFEYYRMSLMALVFLDSEPRDILVVGLGAGAVPRYLNKYFPGAEIDVVEIDPEVLNVAGKYFSFRENDRMKVHSNDGRIYIKKTKRKYDLVFLDAYRNGSIPFHLTTREFLAEVKKVLKPGGVVTSNIMSPSANEFHDSMIVTYRNSFEHLHIFAGNSSGNYIFVATDQKKNKRPKEIRERAKKLMTERKMDVDLPGMAERYIYGSVLRDVKADELTDDFAPVDILRHRKGGRS